MILTLNLWRKTTDTKTWRATPYSWTARLNIMEMLGFIQSCLHIRCNPHHCPISVSTEIEKAESDSLELQLLQIAFPWIVQEDTDSSLRWNSMGNEILFLQLRSALDYAHLWMCNFKCPETNFRWSTRVVSWRGGSRAWELEAKGLSDKVQGQPVLHVASSKPARVVFEKRVLCCALINICFRMYI